MVLVKAKFVKSSDQWAIVMHIDSHAESLPISALDRRVITSR